MKATIGARLALPFAVFLGGAEVVRNWGDWAFWPFWLVDYLAVGLLLWGWWATRRGQRNAHAGLAGAWGFTCAMFYMSFFSHVYRLGAAGGPVNARLLTWIIGALFAVTVLGFISTLRAQAHDLVSAQRSAPTQGPS